MKILWLFCKNKFQFIRYLVIKKTKKNFNRWIVFIEIRNYLFFCSKNIVIRKVFLFFCEFYLLNFVKYFSLCTNTRSFTCQNSKIHVPKIFYGFWNFLVLDTDFNFWTKLLQFIEFLNSVSLSLLLSISDSIFSRHQ